MNSQDISKDFQDWLQSDDYSSPFIHENNRDCMVIIKVKKNENFDYLFVQLNYKNDIERNQTFEYEGIYYRKNNMVFDIQYSINSLVHNCLDYSDGILKRQLRENVREKIESIINNDINNLDTVTQNKEDVEIDKDYAKREARNYFLDENYDIEDLTYKCNYNPAPWTEDSLLDYIENTEAYVEKEVQKYINNNQHDIIKAFAYINQVKTEYKNFENNKFSNIHIIKKIMNNVKNSNARTVNVTIIKNEIEFSFKTGTETLCRDCRLSGYTTHEIEANQRKEFERLFGKIVGYKPEEIVLITYRKDTLYQKEE